MDDHRRVYGTDRGDDPRPQPGHTYVQLDGGPLDGELLDVTGWDAETLADGAALITERGLYGPGGRALYAPGPDDPDRWEWEGDTP